MNRTSGQRLARWLLAADSAPTDASPMPEPGTLRRAALSVATVAVVVGLLVGGIVGDAYWCAWGMAWVGFPAVALLILWRLPGHVLGWLLWLTGACWAITLVGTAYMGTTVVWLEVLSTLTGRLGFVFLIGIVVLFPSGRAQTRGAQLLLLATTVFGVCLAVSLAVAPDPLEVTRWISPLAVPALGGVTAWLQDGGFALAPMLMLCALVSLVARWRGSQGSERLQYRWFVLSVSVAVLVIITNTLFNYLEAPPGVYAIANALGFNAVPVAIGVAVTRYRLYEIDRVVSRTTSYAAVTALLLLVYATVVTTVTRLLPGSSSAFAVAAATLAAAALFRPLLNRVQRLVDRRFNRSRYDAQQTVESFAGRLRHDVDPDDVRSELLGALESTLQPAQMALWLRGASMMADER